MLKKKLVIIALVMAFPVGVVAAGAAAPDASGGCGVGSKMFEGQRGVAPQVLAMTTNGIAQQTFAVSSGTSGCSQDGVVKSSWKTVMFIDGNKEKIARDMSTGSGESLESLAKLIGIQDQHKAAFFRVTKENFARIFSSDNVTTDQLVVSLKQVLAADSELAQYSQTI
ncbi:MAG: DUF3015 family protein [Sulfuricaulis sp.]|nr:DUF3015 family protein [Sulfuricaulis sp.]